MVDDLVQGGFIDFVEGANRLALVEIHLTMVSPYMIADLSEKFPLED